jgi:hypothetical protein
MMSCERPPRAPQGAPSSEQSDELERFVSAVLQGLRKEVRQIDNSFRSLTERWSSDLAIGQTLHLDD